MAMFSNGGSGVNTYAKFNSKLGKFVIRDGDKKTEFSQVKDIKLTKAGLRDGDYEGTPYTELLLRVEGEDGVAQLAFNVATGACARFVSILNGADLSKPMGFSGQLLKVGHVFKPGDKPLENDYVSISVFQDGSPEGYLKPTAEVPKVTMLEVKSKTGAVLKEVADTSERDAFVREQIALLTEKLAKLSHADGTNEAGDGESIPAGNEPPDDDIPF